MPQLQSLCIKRFKCITDATIELRPLNVIIGTNNSGKSSIIQALHFGVGIYQSLLLTDVHRWESTTLSPQDLLYAPTDSVYSLHIGGRLVERQDNVVTIGMTLDDGRQNNLTISKGRNGNIQVQNSNCEMAKSLAELRKPFSIFTPGLAGVARREQYVSDGVLLRALARGDANLYLRNILQRIDRKGEIFDFVADLQRVFPRIELRINFDEASDETIKVDIKTREDWVPLELAGTGVLQAAQILSYVHLFNPSVLVLDEPDSHLHPNNQRLLCRLLKQLSEDRDIQIVLTTHSRHVVDALSGSAQMLWVRNGTVDIACVEDEVGILLDIGALDIRERIAVGDADVFVLTEDSDTNGLKVLLESSGFNMARTLVLPYHGATSAKNLRPLIGVINSGGQKQVVLHRDRDYMSDEQVEEWKEKIRAMKVKPFVTSGTDIESTFLNAAYLSELNAQLDESGFIALIDKVTHSERKSLIAKYVNGKTEIARKRGELASHNAGDLAASADAAMNHSENHHGKYFLKALKRAFQAEYGDNLSCCTVSPLASDATLSGYSQLIFPK